MLERILREPNLISSAVVAVLNSAVLFGLDWSAEQIAGLNVAVVAVLAIATRAMSTPTSEVVAQLRPGRHGDQVAVAVAGQASPYATGTPVDVEPTAFAA